MAARHYRIAVLLLYLVFFGIALRVFLLGHHIAALVIVLVVWFVCAAWLWFMDGRR